MFTLFWLKKQHHANNMNISILFILYNKLQTVIRLYFFCTLNLISYSAVGLSVITRQITIQNCRSFAYHNCEKNHVWNTLSISITIAYLSLSHSLYIFLFVLFLFLFVFFSLMKWAFITSQFHITEKSNCTMDIRK